jgi:phospholipid/cholesterol/gamma-HCH transport system substrate-binding protein
MQSRSMEILVGFFFALGVAAIFLLTFRVASLDGPDRGGGYRITASFENIGGLKSGSSVTLAGVRIGRVRNIAIDPNTLDATVTMEISSRYDYLPRDSGAKILTAGLLGEQYIGIEPGGDLEVLADGDRLRLTQDALVLENLIGQFLSSMTNRE